MVLNIRDAVRSGLPLNDEIVIDVHCHHGAWSNNYIPNSQDIELAIRHMDRYGLSMSWASASLPGYVDTHWQNSCVLEYVKRYPDRFLGYATLSFNHPENLLSDLKWCYESGLKLGVKMHEYYQPPYVRNDPRLMPVYEFLDERKLVFLHHNFGDPAVLEQLLRQFSNVTFIAAHFGEGYAHILQKYDNLYICTCAGMEHKVTQRFVEKHGADRLVLGSDFSLLDAGYGIGPVAFAKISEEDKRKILGLNAKHILEKMSWHSTLRPTHR